MEYFIPKVRVTYKPLAEEGMVVLSEFIEQCRLAM